MHDSRDVNPRSLGAALVLPLLTLSSFAPPALAEPVFTRIDPLPGRSVMAALGISQDGGVVAARSGGNGFNNRAARWTASGGAADLGTIPGGTFSIGRGVSGDGAVVVGLSGGAAGSTFRAFRWTASDGMQSLGVLPGFTASDASAASGDGSVVVGTCSGATTSRAFRWTAGAGMESISSGTSSLAASAVSSDGTVVAGSVTRDAATRGGAFTWSQAQGLRLLDPVGGGTTLSVPSSVFALSADGSVAVGERYFATENGAIIQHAFRWTAGEGLVDLGTLGVGVPAFSTGLAVSGDGRVVGGTSVNAGLTGSVACVWTEQTGLLEVNQLLASSGVDLTGWVLTSITGLSADGATFTGQGTFEGRTGYSWVVSGVTIPGPGGGCVIGVGAWLIARRGRRAGG